MTAIPALQQIEAAEPQNADFNGDGFDDLAVGVPFENVDTIIDAGTANVIYGSSNGSYSHIRY